MPPSKHRVSKLIGETQSYNIVFHKDILKALRAEAENRQISPAEFVRDAVFGALLDSDYLSSPMPKLAPVKPQLRTYAEGVIDACNRIKKDSRLKMRLAAGGTAGEAMANNIRSALLKGD